MTTILEVISYILKKFSYHDLKNEVDEDILDYTKKIYSTVNDIQTKLIAVPAAYLLIFNSNLI